MSAEYMWRTVIGRDFVRTRHPHLLKPPRGTPATISAIPVLNELTHLPVILDPSHATGKRSLVPAVARAGVAVGADGLIVEAHPAPERAISDGAQSLDLNQFAKMMSELKP